MIPVSLSNANKSLAQLIEKTVADSEETLIVTEKGSVVMIDQKEWENIQETLNLLRDKKSLKALLDGHRERKEGRRPSGVSVEEAFNDL